jgi:hypothetical protein
MGAGIGAGYANTGESNCGPIFIRNARVEAWGSNGAGIGSAFAYKAVSRTGPITIINSNISADGQNAAGIGSGYADVGSSVTGAITINRSTIYAVGRLNAAGIGSGYSYSANSNTGPIAIRHSVVEAVGDAGAAIGSGYAESASSRIDSIFIDGGTYNLIGIGGPGIGSGEGQQGDSHVPSIEIVSGTFFIFGDTSSGIGSGCGRWGNSAVDNIIIHDGTFFIYSTRGAGIGSGFVYHGTSRVGRIVIEKGTFEIISSDGAAIGSGPGDTGLSVVENITILDGHFNATATGRTSAIGAGLGEGGTSRVDNLRLANGTYYASGWVAVGSSRQGVVTNLSFVGNGGNHITLDCRSSRLFFCISADRTFAHDITVTAQTNALTYFETISRLPGSDVSGLHFYGLYEPPNSELESLGNAPRFHLTNIKGLQPGNYTFTIMRVDVATRGRTIGFDTAKDHGLLAVVPAGVYEVAVRDRAGLDIGLLKNAGDGHFTVRPGELLVTEAILNGVAPTTASVKSEKLAPGAIAGISIAVIIFVAAAVVGVVFVLRRRESPGMKIESNVEPPEYTTA